MLIEKEEEQGEAAGLLLLKQPECIEVSEAIRAQGVDDLTSSASVQCAIAVVYGCLFLLGLLGNGSVLLAFAQNKRLARQGGGGHSEQFGALQPSVHAESVPVEPDSDGHSALPHRCPSDPLVRADQGLGLRAGDVPPRASEQLVRRVRHQLVAVCHRAGQISAHRGPHPGPVLASHRRHHHLLHLVPVIAAQHSLPALVSAGQRVSQSDTNSNIRKLLAVRNFLMRKSFSFMPFPIILIQNFTYPPPPSYSRVSMEMLTYFLQLHFSDFLPIKSHLAQNGIGTEY